MRVSKKPRIYSNTDLLNTRAASIYLGGEIHPISLSTLALWRRKGIGPNFIKIGNSIRYPIKDLLDFIQSVNQSSKKFGG